MIAEGSAAAVAGEEIVLVETVVFLAAEQTVVLVASRLFVVLLHTSGPASAGGADAVAAAVGAWLLGWAMVLPVYIAVVVVLVGCLAEGLAFEDPAYVAA